MKASSEVEILNFDNSDLNAHIRVIKGKNGTLFIAKDVCDFLEIRNSRDAVAQLDDDEKGVISNDALNSNVGSTDIRNPNRGLQYVTESGLYKLIFKSRKPAAQLFLKWVTSVVLPSIRKTGGYGKRQKEAYFDPYKGIRETTMRKMLNSMADIGIKMGMTRLDSVIYAYQMFQKKTGIDMSDEIALSREMAPPEPLPLPPPPVKENPEVIKDRLLAKRVVEHLSIWMDGVEVMPFTFQALVNELFEQGAVKGWLEGTMEGDDFVLTPRYKSRLGLLLVKMVTTNVEVEVPKGKFRLSLSGKGRARVYTLMKV